MIASTYRIRTPSRFWKLLILKRKSNLVKWVRYAIQVTLTYCVISSLGKVTAVRPREPPVSKDNPYHSLSYSCFFQGKTSIYKLIYNLRENLCYSFYGRLEIDAESEEADIQAITSVQGCLIINGTRIETAALQQITEVTPDQKFCEYTYSLLIYDNPLLTEIKFGKKFRPSSADIFIRNNPKLRSTGIIGAGFKVDIGSGADCLVNEANSNTNCESVVGDVNIADLSSDTWNRIKEVHGTVHVEKTSVSDINHLENLKIVGWKTPALVISKNKNLIDISALLTMSIESKYKPIEIKDNPNICHAIDEEQKLKQWLSGMKSSVKFSRKCLKECAGGQVTNSYLASLDKRCNVIEGTLDISGLKEPPGNFSRLEQVEQIKGRLVVRSSSFIKDLSFLKNLREIKTDGSYKYSYKLLIYGNPQLEKVEFDKKFHLEPNETLIRLNPKLTTAGLKGPKSQVDISEENDCFVEDVGTMNNCTRVIGDVKFDELSSETWQRVITVEGTLHIENTDIESLDAMKDLQIVGLMTPALVISKNKKLVDIAALMSMNITSEEPVLEFKDNPVVCHNIVERRALDKWTTEKGIYVKFAENCLKSCPGGVVTSEYLANLDKRCNFIKGNLIIDKIKDLPTNMNKLEQVEKIYGRLFITNNEAVEDLRFLRNLKDIINSGHERPALVIENNKNLINTTLESLKRVREGEWKETTRWHLEDILTWDPDSYGGEGEVSIEGIYGRPTGTKAEDDYPLLLGLAAFIVFLVAIAAAIGILTTIKLRKKACGPSSRRKKERTPKAMGKKRTFFKQRGRLNKGTPTEKSKTPTPAKQSGRPTKGTPTGKSKTPTPAQQSGRLNKGTPTAEQSKTPTPAKQSGRLNKGTPAGKSKAPTPAQQSGRQNKGTPTAASRTPTPLKESKRPQKAAPHLKNKKPVAAGQHR